MKKFSSYFVLFMILQLQGQSQNYLGPVTGISIACWNDLEDSEGATYSFKSGISIGAALELSIDTNFSIQPELRYTQMGSGIRIDTDFGLIEYKLNLNYISIPILAKYKFGLQKTKFFLQAGPRIGFGIGDVSLTAGGETISQSWEEVEVKKFDFGFEFDAGVQFAVGTAIFFFDAGYYYGLQKLNSGELPGNAKNNAIGINIGYLFKIGI